MESSSTCSIGFSSPNVQLSERSDQSEKFSIPVARLAMQEYGQTIQDGGQVNLNYESDYVQLVKTVEGKVIHIHWNQQKGVEVKAQNNDGECVSILAEDIPEELRGISSCKQLHECLQGVSFTLIEQEEGKVFLRFSKYLPSSSQLSEVFPKRSVMPDNSTYSQQLEEFRGHLSDLVNPFLVQDLKAALSKLVEGRILFDPGKGIAPLFDTIVIPDDTRKYTERLNKSIMAEFNNIFDCSILQSKANTLKANLKSLVEEKLVEPFSWPELDKLWSLDEIKGLRNKHTGKIKDYINKEGQGHIEVLRKYIKKKLKENGVIISNLNKKLKSKKENDLDTLIGQAVKKKPIAQDGISAHWNKSEGFFLHKILDLRNPETQEEWIGCIQDCRREGKTMSFLLDNDINLTITLNDKEQYYEVHARRKIKYSLWSALVNRTVQDVFEIQSSGDLLLIERGIYKLQIINKDLWQKTRGMLKQLILPARFTPSHFQMVLTRQTDQKQYTLYSYHKKDQEHPAQIAVISESDENCISYNQFKEMYFTFNEDSKTFSVKLSKANEYMKIRDVVDEDSIQKSKLEAVNKRIEELRKDLREGKYKSFLHQLIDQLIENKLEIVNLEFVESQALCEELKTLENMYKIDLGIIKTAPQLLKEIVLEANYALITHKRYSILMANTLELMREANIHLEKMKNKDVILFMGNTGAGKSATICYFLGGKVKYFQNKFGQTVVRLKKDQDSMPVIGQSLGVSETIYARGYEMPLFDDEDIHSTMMLADFPGFGDTRGREYEICTSLSMDWVVKRANAIKSIVLVVPFNAFEMDRANPVIELMAQIKSMFPNVLNLKHPDHQCIHILITRYSHLPGEMVDSLKSGAFIKQLLREQRDQKTHDEGNENELTLAYREKTLLALQSMFENKRINFIDIKDQDEKEERLKQYGHSIQGLDKASYIPMMQNERMDEQFRSYMEMLAETWSSLISKYLDDMPIQIERLEKKRERVNVRIQHLIQKKQEDEKDLIQYKQDIHQMQQLVDRIEEAQSQENPTSLPEEINIKLKEMVDQTTEINVRIKQDTLANISAKILERKVRIQELNTNIEYLEKQINDNIQAKMALLIQSSELEEGDVEEILEELYYEPNQEFEIGNVSASISKQKFQAIESLRPEDWSNLRRVNTSTYKGKLSHQVVVSKDYQLIPTDEASRREFEATDKTSVIWRTVRSWFGGKTNEVSSIGQYTIQLRGRRICIDLGRKATIDGKKVIYSLISDWRGDDILPWFKIVHFIPKKHYHAATIINNQSKMQTLSEQVNEAGIELQEDQDKKEEFENDIKGLEEQIEEGQAELKLLKKATTKEKMSEILEQEKKKLSRVEEQIRLLECSIEKEDDIKIAKDELKIVEDDLHKMLRKKRHLALIIKTRKETADLLLQFAKMGLSNYRKAEKFTKMTEECQKFIELYEPNIGKLQTACNEDLGFKLICLKTKETI